MPKMQSFFSPTPKPVMKQSPMEAELRWVWHSALKSKSFASEDDSADLFRVMFPDSTIAKDFTCGRTKQSYLLNFAIAPYCKEQIFTDIGDNFYSMSFDETDGMMMVVVRYVSDGVLRTEMLDLVSLQGDFTAANCKSVIVSVIDDYGLPRSHCISGFSDSCNTMRGKCFYIEL
jgi:hypothetical protein